MAITRSGGKHLNVQASLLHGKVQLVELALRTAAGAGGVLNISHRVPFDDLAKRMPGAVLAFVPASMAEQAMYTEYVRYFGAKARAGVANLDANDSLYMVPPVGEASGLLAALEASGAPSPLPRNCLLGVITARPSAQGIATAAERAKAAEVTKATAEGDAPASEGDTSKPTGTETSAPSVAPPVDTSAAASEKAEGAPSSEKKEEASSTKAPGDGDSPTGEMSGEALMDLFNNPELLRSLQGIDDDDKEKGE